MWLRVFLVFFQIQEPGCNKSQALVWNDWYTFDSVSQKLSICGILFWILDAYSAYLQSPCRERPPSAWILWGCSESPATNDEGAAESPSLGMPIPAHIWLYTQRCICMVLIYKDKKDHSAYPSSCMVLDAWIFPACRAYSWALHLLGACRDCIHTFLSLLFGSAHTSL